MIIFHDPTSSANEVSSGSRRRVQNTFDFENLISYFFPDVNILVTLFHVDVIKSKV